MKRYLITYDLPSKGKDPHRQFLLQAEPLGLLYVYRSRQSGELLRLPNTTVWGIFVDRAAAVAAFDAALVATGKKLGQTVRLEKRVVTALSSPYFASDERKPPETAWTGTTDFGTCRLHQQNDPFFA